MRVESFVFLGTGARALFFIYTNWYIKGEWCHWYIHVYILLYTLFGSFSSMKRMFRQKSYQYRIDTVAVEIATMWTEYIICGEMILEFVRKYYCYDIVIESFYLFGGMNYDFYIRNGGGGGYIYVWRWNIFLSWAIKLLHKIISLGVKSRFMKYNCIINISQTKILYWKLHCQNWE